MTAPPFYRHFSWEHSYFSGKTRAYLRYKQRMGDLGAGFEDILATRDLIQGLLLPRSGTAAVPQLEAPDGTWVQDTAEMIDYCEAAHAKAPVIPGPLHPKAPGEIAITVLKAPGAAPAGPALGDRAAASPARHAA